MVKNVFLNYKFFFFIYSYENAIGNHILALVSNRYFIYTKYDSEIYKNKLHHVACTIIQQFFVM